MPPKARGSLIIPRRHVASIFDLPAPEQADVLALLTRLRAQLQTSLRPDAFTVGSNHGAAAGQAVGQAQAT